MTVETAAEISLTSLSPFGIEVTGLNVETVTDEELSTLKQLLADQGVAVIRNQSSSQTISDDTFVRFLQRLGQLTFTVGEKPVVGHPLLNIVSNVGRDRPPRSVFHTDTSYVAKPPAYTSLRAVKLPRQGGETLFCNQYTAYDRLPRAVSQKLQGAEILHVVSGLSLEDGEETQTWQPLFRQHPTSGKVAMYLSTPERCQRLRIPSGELSVEKSQQVIRLLYLHSIRRCQLYRHHWQSGDIVLWDNRCTMHRADHSNVIGDRVLHRGLITEG
ncbi:MAG: TauD/TfdA dioxygenase family protein [Phormidesmis sp.]